MNRTNQDRNKDLLVLQKIILELSEKFIYAKINNLDDIIQEALETVGKAVNADRTYIFRHNLKEEVTDNTHEWCQEGINPEIDNLQGLPISMIEDWLESHKNGRAHEIYDVSKIPIDIQREVLTAQKIQSLVTVPMMIGETIYGFVGFDSVRTKRVYSTQERDLLMAFANMIVGIQERVRIEEKLMASESMLNNILNTIPTRVFWKDNDLVYQGANQAFIQDSGLSSLDDLIGSNDFDLAWKSKAEQFRDDDRKVIKKGKPILNYREDSFDAKGNIRSLKTSKVPLKNSRDEIIGILGTYEDITAEIKLARKIEQQSQEIKQKNAEFNLMVNSVKDIIFELDTKCHHVSIYGKLLDSQGLKPSMFIGKTAIDLFGEEAGRLHVDMAKKALAGHETQYEWSTNVDDNVFHYQTVLSPIYKDNSITGVVGVVRDITVQKSYLEEIEYLSYHDFLTGLKNRRYFEEYLERLNHEKYLPLSLMMVDLNGLKLFNDAFGHAVGDRALIKVAEVLKECLDNDAIIARIGGDEFAILLINKTYEDCENYKDLITQRLNQVNIYEIELSVSIGHETRTSLDLSTAGLLKSAEDFMYRRKLIEGHSRQNKAIQTILNTLSEKYETERVHSKRVSRIAKLIGKELGLNQDQLEELSLAAMLHDIGKISIPDAILGKPSALSKEEYNLIKNHTINGYQLLKAADEYSDIAEYALSHHERIDGTGYPKGLKGNEIPLFARIISVADAYEVMTADRPYRKALGKTVAIEELKKYAGTQFDQEIVNTFIDRILLTRKRL